MISQDPKKISYPLSPIISLQIIEDILSNVVDHCTLPPLKEVLTRNELRLNNESNHPKIKYLSYNVLADTLSEANTDEAYDFEQKYMKFEYRWPLVVEEIRSYNPDIICLQEVDKDDDTYFKAFREDYYTFFKSRSGDKADGVAIMISMKKFKVLDQFCVEFLLDKEHLLLNRDNVCLIVAVEHHELPGHVFFVANTHLIFNDTRGDVKVSQIVFAIRALQQISELKRYEGLQKHFFYSGDFNLIPQSSLYSLMGNASYDFRTQKRNLLSAQRQGRVSGMMRYPSIYDALIRNTNKFKAYPDNKETDILRLVKWLQELHKVKVIVKEPVDGEMSKVEFSLEEVDFAQVPKDDKFFTLNLPIKFTSAYSSFQEQYYKEKPDKNFKYESYPKYSTYEPIITSAPHESRVTVDYIWYNSLSSNKHTLKVNSVIETFKYEKVIRYNMYPNRIFPSDHFSLIVEFEIVENL